MICDKATARAEDQPEKIRAFIRHTGKERKTYHIITLPNFDLVDMMFDSDEQARKYAEGRNIEVVNYQEGGI